MDRRTVLWYTGATLAAMATAGCSSGTSDGPRTVSMTDGFAFEPATLSVPSGTTVRWVNDGEIAHTVTADEGAIPSAATYFASGGFESEQAARNDVSGGLLGSDESFEHTFEVSGNFEYYCIPHEGSGMRGRIEVD